MSYLRTYLINLPPPARRGPGGGAVVSLASLASLISLVRPAPGRFEKGRVDTLALVRNRNTNSVDDIMYLYPLLTTHKF
eukprot:scaffold771_cov147-Skeletonema_menzelii.AAC.10